SRRCRMGAQPYQWIHPRPNMAILRSRTQRSPYTGALSGCVAHGGPLCPQLTLTWASRLVSRRQESQIGLLAVGLDLLAGEAETPRFHVLHDHCLVGSTLVLPIRRDRRLQHNLGHVLEP